MPEPDVHTEKMISVLTPEVSAQVRRLRMRYALWESGCLTGYDDHGPWGHWDLVPHVPIQRRRIYTGFPEAGSYNHHSQLVKFKGKYHFIFSNGIVDEEEAGQRTMLSTSDDGRHWSQAKCIIPGDVERGMWRNTIGLYTDGSQLVAWTQTNWDKVRSTEPGMSSTGAATKRQIDAYVSTDGENWVPHENIAPEVFCFFEAPRLTQAGTLLTGGTALGGAAALRWTPANIVGPPEVIPIPATETGGVFPYGEATWYQTNDGCIWTYWRDEGGSCRLYLSLSEDDGQTWTPPLITEFPDSMSRVYAGQLPDGRFYLIGNAYPKLLDRMHLMIAISEDGAKFSKLYTLLDDPTAQRVKGTLKCHGYQYPCGLVDGDKLLVGYSINKEDIECGIVQVADL